MSLYNMLFGMNSDTETILAALSLTRSDIERFRDCWADDVNDRIVILTRTGGGNREYYPNAALVQHPLYLSDKDDDFDPTYAYYYFSLPETREENENAVD